MAEEFQTRNQEGELRFFDTFAEALRYANDTDRTVWKISFRFNDEAFRLVRMYDQVVGRHTDTFAYESIDLQNIEGG